MLRFFLLLLAIVFTVIQFPYVQEKILLLAYASFENSSKKSSLSLTCDYGIFPFLIRVSRLSYLTPNHQKFDLKDLDIMYVPFDGVYVNSSNFSINTNTPLKKIGITKPIIFKGNINGKIVDFSSLDIQTTLKSIHFDICASINAGNVKADIKTLKPLAVNDFNRALPCLHFSTTLQFPLSLKEITIHKILLGVEKDKKKMFPFLKKPTTLRLNSRSDLIKLSLFPWNTIIDITDLVIPYELNDNLFAFKKNAQWEGNMAISTALPFAITINARLYGKEALPSIKGMGNIKNIKIPEISEIFFNKASHIDFDFYGNDSDFFLNAKLKTELIKVAGVVHFSLKELLLKKASILAKTSLSNIQTRDVIKGNVTCFLSAQGPFSNMKIMGDASLVGGVYTNLETGTHIENVHLNAKLKERRLVITKCFGQDSSLSQKQKPSIFQGKGYIDFAKTIPLLDISLNFNDFQVADSPFFIGRFTGVLGLHGPLSKPSLYAKARVNKARVTLDEVNNPQKIKIINKKKKQNKIKKNKTSFSIPMHIELEILEKLYIRGMGFESEWKGNLTVEGDTSAPFLNGTIRAKRGFFSFLKKRLIIKKGTISYAREYPNEPLLMIVTQKVDSLGRDILLTLEGRVPDISINATTLPTTSLDNALSLLIFDEEAKNIGPFQSLRLAMLLKTMKKNNDIGFNLIDQLQSVFDNIPIYLSQKERYNSKKMESTTTTSIGLSKQFSNNVTISVGHGVTNDSPELTTRIPVGKNLSLEAFLSSGTSGIGFNYEKRY